MYSPREAKKDFLYASRAYLFIAIFVGAVLFALSFREGFPYALLSIDGKTALGRVTQIVEHSSTRRIDYLFRDPGGVSRTGTIETRRKRSIRLATGDSLEVLYSTVLPSLSHPKFNMRELRSGFYVFAVSLFLIVVAAAMAFATLLSILKHRAAEKRY
jgi:hypothetical protein